MIRAREAATLLLGTLDREEMVERFLDVYAAENRRPGRADQPSHYREQRETIRREAVLAMVARIESALPARLKVRVVVKQPTARSAKNRKRNKGAKRIAASRKKATGIEIGLPLLDLFREEFFVALGQGLNWREEEASEFWRDLELYESLSGSSGRGAGGKMAVSGPFVDRTAFLLDPSLMEQARRAAARFQRELFATADRVVRKAFAARKT